MRTKCEQLLAEHRKVPSLKSQQEHRRTNKLMYLGYLDTVEVIGSIPVAPTSQSFSNQLHPEMPADSSFVFRRSSRSPGTTGPRRVMFRDGVQILVERRF
jgi:hypothetical protein